MATSGTTFRLWSVTMSELFFPSAEFEKIWREIKQLLEWNQGFGFYLVFGEEQRPLDELRQRVQDATRLQSKTLQLIRPLEPTTAEEEVLTAILSPAPLFTDYASPIWLDLTMGPEDKPWQTVRQRVLAALNRQRSRLEIECQRPLFVSLPVTMAAEVVTWAPDLWSIRQYIALLPNTALPSTNTGSDKADKPEEAGILSPELQQLTPARLRRKMIELGNNGENELDSGHIDIALIHFRQAWQIATYLYQLIGATPQTLRDLSISLDKVADCQKELGQLPLALSHYQQSLELCQQLRQQLGDTPQALRDLSVSLNNVAYCQQKLGQLPLALNHYKQSLDLCRQLRQQLGDTPQALHDLSISLEMVASCQAELGQPQLALSLYQQSLELRLQLRQQLGDTPQTLRDLSISLEMVASCQAELGQPQLALSLYQQSLELRLQLRHLLGDTPQVLRDLAASFERVAGCQQAIGNYPAALEGFKQSLEYCKQLQQQLGDTPQTMQALAKIWQKIGECNLQAQEPELAEAAFNEQKVWLTI